jgi:hypothetical protein
MRKHNKVNKRDGGPGVSRRLVLFAGALVVAAAGAWLVLADSTPARADTIVVKMSPLCGCCGEWVEYMRQGGYKVTVIETEDIVAAKQEAAVPDDLYSCHTAQVAGYVVEGHVPLAAVDKLLSERPAIDGIALAGMPPGSPGMGGQPWSSYPVEAFRDGRLDGRFMDAPLN